LQLRRILTAVLALVALVAGLALTAPAAPAEAANNADFRADNIISDSVFFNSNTMSAGDIQNFLADKGRNCVAGSAPCIKDFRADSPSRPAQGAGHCGAYPGGSNELASTIIYKAAKACGINPQVLIVTLEKEQSLITGTRPSATRFAIAMGFDCPDTRACGSSSMGFEYQMYKAAWQFRQYTLTPNYFRYKPGNIAVQFNPNAACGSTVVNIKNQATANLYNYTPYQPNAAALAAGAGVGDSCSAYGNRNFFRFFTDWFGSPVNAVPSLVGSFDGIASSYDSLTVTGWALDPQSTTPVDVHIYVDGAGIGVAKTNASRPDVAVHYPSYGTQRGFSATFTVPGGSADKNVCAYAVNGKTNTLLGCKTVNIPSASPIGVLEGVVAVPGGVSVSGWTLDPERYDSLDVHIYVDGVGQRFVANAQRPDVARAYPAWGAEHGFSVTLKPGSGTHSVCVYAINVGKGGTTTLGCQSVSVMAGNPIGSFDAATAVPGGIDVSGWAIDPDTKNAIPVHVYVDSAGTALTANLSRSDIGRAFPAYGPAHGFSRVLKASAGAHQVCAYAINEGAGATVLMGCKTVQVQSGSPFGTLEEATVSGRTIKVSGWAIDPDTADPIDVHFYVDDKGVALKASASRADVGAGYPAYGPKHGYSGSMTTTPGTKNVCAYAINEGPGGTTLLGCRSVTVR
jgi:hypothetical protein